MFETIKSDLKRHYKIDLGGNMNPSFLSVVRLIMDKPGVQATIIYRFGRFIRSKMSSSGLVGKSAILILPFYKVISWVSGKALGINISDKALIGPAFYINHFGGIVIEECKIGENCSVHQLVKIQSSNESLVEIGNNVWIGPHSILNSNVKIGNGSTVGAGCVLNGKFPDNVLIMGDPARITAKNYDNAQLL